MSSKGSLGEDNVLKDILGGESDREPDQLPEEMRSSYRAAAPYDARQDIREAGRPHGEEPRLHRPRHRQERYYPEQRDSRLYITEEFSDRMSYYDESYPRHPDDYRDPYYGHPSYRHDYEYHPQDYPYPPRGDYHLDNRVPPTKHREDDYRRDNRPDSRDLERGRSSEFSRKRPSSAAPPALEEPDRKMIRIASSAPPSKSSSTATIASTEEGEVNNRKLLNTTDGKKYSISPIVFDLKEGSKSCRFFTARCDYYDMFAKSKRDLGWKVPPYVAQRIYEAYREDDSRLLLFFTVQGSQYWQGVAEVDRNGRFIYSQNALTRIPLNWIAIGDVPYFASPKVPGLISKEDDEVTASFEIPAKYGAEFLALFERFHLEDRTFGLGTTRLAPLIRQSKN